MSLPGTYSSTGTPAFLRIIPGTIMNHSGWTAHQGTAIVTPAPLQTEEANRFFLDRVSKIPGCRRVEVCGKNAGGEQTLLVYLRRDDLQAEYAVYDLKGQAYDRYPEARLDITVLEEIEEPEAEPSTLTSVTSR